MYELTVVLPSEFTDAKLKGVLDKLEKAIDSAGGKIKKTERWGKRDLAYPIDKNKEGIYYFFEMGLPNDKIASLDRLLYTDDQILRHLIIRSDVKKVKKVKETQTVESKPAVESKKADKKSNTGKKSKAKKKV